MFVCPHCKSDKLKLTQSSSKPYQCDNCFKHFSMPDAINETQKILADEISEMEINAVAYQQSVRELAIMVIRLRRKLATDWQPIETAPKDGGTIIIAVKTILGYWNIGTAYWVDEQSRGISGWMPRGVLRDFNGGYNDLALGNPTHWVPLPETPDIKQSDESGDTK